MSEILIAPIKGASREQNAINNEYGLLSVRDMRHQASDAERERLTALRDQVIFPIIFTTREGKVLMSIGSREAQIDRELGHIVARMLSGSAKPEDKMRMGVLQDERAARLMLGRFRTPEQKRVIEAALPPAAPKQKSRFGLGFLGL